MTTKRTLKVVVVAKCIGCGMRREIAENEVVPGDHPCCTSCGMPMIAAHAQSQAGGKRRRK